MYLCGWRGISILTFACIVPIVSAASLWAAQCSETGPRIECGYYGIEEAECVQKGCCWKPFTIAHIRQPWCFTKNAGQSIYNVTDSKTQGDGVDALLESVESTQPELGPDIQKLSLQAQAENGALHVRITDAQSRRWDVPPGLLGEPGVVPSGALKNLHLQYQNYPFSFSVSREASTDDVLFDTKDHRLIFKDQYLEVTGSISNSSSLFGLGERTNSAGLMLPRNGVPVALWNRDMPSQFADQNLYGSHSFLMELQSDGTAWGVFLLNSNAMDVVLTETTISYRVLGGILDFYFFAGPSPAHVMEQYTRLIGRPRMPPFWSLGFHQCKYGYKSADEVREVVRNYSAANIPLDTMWTDIDYMSAWKDFTLDSHNFPHDKMQRLVEELHEKGMQYVVIVDPGIKAERGYPAYERGLQADVFIKDVTGKPYLGQVWPGATHFPDFLNPATEPYWERELRDFHELLPYDGLWIDMNEASNFCTGEVCRVPPTEIGIAEAPGRLEAWTDCYLKCSTLSQGANRSLLFPVYSINNGNSLLPLSYRTIPTTATHFDGSLQYNTHNLYGVLESKVTARVLENIRKKRSFTLSRSTFPGIGSHAAHWTGDNAATWNDLRWSIASILTSGLSGIPFVGADICGFILNTTEQLCNRWISAGAFYPFSRDHSDLHTSYQELYRWPSVAESGRKALGLRYRLLSYLQTAFREASHTGSPVAKALWFNYPDDSSTHSLDRQWLLGNDLLISPVLDEDSETIDAYFPGKLWYDAFSNKKVEGGRWHRLDLPLGDLGAHFRAASIVPLQREALTSSEVHKSPFTLVVSMPELGSAFAPSLEHGAIVAQGLLFFEEGDHIEMDSSRVEVKMEVTVQLDTYSSTLIGTLRADLSQSQTPDDLGCTAVPLPHVEQVTLLGWNLPVDKVIVESSVAAQDRQPGKASPQWEELESGALVINNLNLSWRCLGSFLTWSSTIPTLQTPSKEVWIA